MKVAVTGASGHIGYAVINTLLERGLTPRVFIHKNNPFEGNKNVEVVRGSMLQKDDLKNLLEGCTHLIHCAAMVSIGGDKSGDIYTANVEGLRNVMEVALETKIKRMVHLSTVHVYDISSVELLTEEAPYIPDHKAILYEKSKRDGQILAMEYARRGLDIVLLNPTSVYGAPDLSGSRQNQAVWDLYRNKYPFLFRGGYDWVDVNDVSGAAVNALQMGRTGEAYLLSGKYMTLKELSYAVASVKGSKIPAIELPVWMVRSGVPFVKLYAKAMGNEPLLSHDAIDILLNSPKNISSIKAKKDLNFRIRPETETIKGIIEHFKNQRR